MGVDHDITPACFGALGRRGDAAAMTKARKLMGGAPSGGVKSSDNIEMIHAVCDAVVWRDYRAAKKWFDHMRDPGIGEGGPLYFPAGDVGYVVALATVAEEDGALDVYDDATDYLAWAAHVLDVIAVPKRPSKQRHHFPNITGENDRSIVGGPVKNPHMPGPRAAFGIDGGWYAEGIAASIYDWLLDNPDRQLANRFQQYEPGGPTWDSWAWLISTLRGWIPASRDRQPTRLRKAFTRQHLNDLIDGLEPEGAYQSRFGLDVVRGDHYLLVAVSHPTSQPKAVAATMWWSDADNTVHFAYPDGKVNYQVDAKGFLAFDDRHVWADATGKDADGVFNRISSPKFRRAGVRSHLVLRPRTKRWVEGVMHPREPVPAPPPPAPPPDEDDDRDIFDRIGDALSRLWHWLEARF